VAKVLAAAVVGAIVAASGIQRASAEPAAPLARCATTAKAVAKFKRSMSQQRKVYFRTHRSARQRKAFVKKQRAKLKALQRTHARCLRRTAVKPKPPPAPPPPAPSPAPPPPVLDTTPPDLAVDSPAEGFWFDQPSATVRGAAIDLQSGIDSVTCNSRPATLTGPAFTCTVALAEGVNTITVRALDRAGNARVARRVLKYGAGVLAGPPTQAALEAVRDLDSGEIVADSEIAVDSDGRRVARTLLELALEPTAPLEDVNRLLEAVDARIVSMLDDVAIVVVAIPDPLAGARTPRPTRRSYSRYVGPSSRARSSSGARR
jgi:hypothetical protein